MKKACIWVLAVVITLASAVWQRTTGPTHPLRGSVELGGEEYRVVLTRSHETVADQPVSVTVADPAVTGEVAWRRYPTDDPWRRIAMQRDGERLTAALPRQPAAGKLEYSLHLVRDGEEVAFPDRPAITRFKDPVPAAALIPHIIFMFLVMMLGNAAGLFALTGWGKFRGLAWVVFGSLAIGGFIFGPIVQKYAFGDWWTGFPFGTDLTDNKTLVAGIAWTWAVWRLWRGHTARVSVVAATVVTIVIFAIPHSMMGSQLDWDELPPDTCEAPLETAAPRT